MEKMKVKNIIKMIELDEMTSVDVWSEDGRINYGTENGYYKLSEEVMEMTVKKIKPCYGSLSVYVKADPSIERFDYFKFKPTKDGSRPKRNNM